MQVHTSVHFAPSLRAPFRASAAPGVLEQLAAHARRVAPHECCGVLLGRMRGNRVDVTAAAPCRNAAADVTARFIIPARDVLAAQRTWERAELDVVGFYHSHPRGDACPSPADVEGAPAGYLHVIIAGDQVRAWRRPEPDSPLEEVSL